MSKDFLDCVRDLQQCVNDAAASDALLNQLDTTMQQESLYTADAAPTPGGDASAAVENLGFNHALGGYLVRHSNGNIYLNQSQANSGLATGGMTASECEQLINPPSWLLNHANQYPGNRRQGIDIWFVYWIHYRDADDRITRSQLYAGGQTNVLLAEYDGYLSPVSFDRYRWLYNFSQFVHPDNDSISLEDYSYEQALALLGFDPPTAEGFEVEINDAGESGSYSYTNDPGDGIDVRYEPPLFSPVKVTPFHDYLLQFTVNFDANSTMSIVESGFDFSEVDVKLQCNPPSSSIGIPVVAAIRLSRTSTDLSTGLAAEFIESADFIGATRTDHETNNVPLTVAEQKAALFWLSVEFSAGRGDDLSALFSSANYAADISGTFQLRTNPSVIYCSRSDQNLYVAVRRLVAEDTWALDYFENDILIQTVIESDAPIENELDWRASLAVADPWQEVVYPEDRCELDYIIVNGTNILNGVLSSISPDDLLNAIDGDIEVLVTQRPISSDIPSNLCLFTGDPFTNPRPVSILSPAALAASETSYQYHIAWSSP